MTFQEVRTHLGFATPRNRSAKSVLRTAPWLPGCFSLVSLIFWRQVGKAGLTLASDPWYAKADATFADAVAAVRRLCWTEVLKWPQNHERVPKLPSKLRRMLLDQLSHAT